MPDDKIPEGCKKYLERKIIGSEEDRDKPKIIVTTNPDGTLTTMADMSGAGEMWILCES
jgi:hypothetical protein